MAPHHPQRQHQQPEAHDRGETVGWMLAGG